jgi:transcriptional regulator GlxA family with amidase domain
MNTRLDHIGNWPELAREANWSSSVLAEKCGVSLRTLERFFLNYSGTNPRAWLDEQRQRRAIELLKHGLSVKEVANQLAYKDQRHFSHAFKRRNGHAPRQHPVQFDI